MPSDKKTGMVIPAGILQPTAPREAAPPAAGEGQGGEAPAAGDRAAAPELKPQAPRVRKKRAATATAERLEGRRIYLSEGVHFRLRMLAYQRGVNISQAAEEVLDKALPRYDVNRIG